MVPLPLMSGDAEARARVRVNRNRGCAEDEAVLQHGQSAPCLAWPQLASCASSGRAWWIWVVSAPREKPAHWRPATASDA